MRSASGSVSDIAAAAHEAGASGLTPLRASVSVLDDVPGAVESVAGHVARFLILRPRVERFALVRPLLAAVVAGNDRPVARRLGIGRGHQRRPVAGARSIACALASGVLVEGIERHSRGVGHHPAHFLGGRLSKSGADNGQPDEQNGYLFAYPHSFLPDGSIQCRISGVSTNTPRSKLFRSRQATSCGRQTPAHALDCHHHACAQPIDSEDQLSHLIAALAVDSSRAEIRGLALGNFLRRQRELAQGADDRELNEQESDQERTHQQRDLDWPDYAGSDVPERSVGQSDADDARDLAFLESIAVLDAVSFLHVIRSARCARVTGEAGRLFIKRARISKTVRQYL